MHKYHIMRNLILISFLLFSASLFSQDIEKISSKANEYSGMKQYQQSIEQCKIGLAISGDDKVTLLYKSFICEILYRIYKTENFEAYNMNLSYSYLKQAADFDIQYKKKCGTYDSEKTKLEQKLEQMLVDFPGCDKDKNEIASANKITNTPNTDKTVTITVSGSGKSQVEAKQSALRSAIEQAFGAFISAKTEILNDQIVSDQIASVASGNIQSFDILNETQLPDGSWGVTLKAIVSIDKLTSFVEAKGIAIEIKGGLFALNIKQQLLNEQGEIKAINEMVEILHQSMQIAYDYSIKSEEPISIDDENKNWEILLTVMASANKNMDFCANYCLKTLAALSLTPEEVTSYKNLNKEVFSVVVNYKDVSKTFYLRRVSSINALNTLTIQWESYKRLFSVQSGIDETIGNPSRNNRNYSEYKNDANIGFLTLGQEAATFSWKDKRTLAQIEQMTGYKVKPRGVISYPIKDIDGNVYRTIIIGTKVWMADNLKVTKYNDGTPIPNITDNALWAAQTIGAYCDYNNNPTNSITYGRLYNRYAVNTGKLAPKDWHVATQSEWSEEINNSFFPIYCGSRSDSYGTFSDLDNGLWWTSTPSNGYFWYIQSNKYGTNDNYNGYSKSGYSVLCVKDK